VLLRALQVFWRQGYAATTIDNLATAMGLSKPSLYNAYGDKHAIYRQALAAFVAQVEQEVEGALAGSADIRDALRSFFKGAIAVYCAESPALGCFAICTATAEAVSHGDIQGDLKRIIARLDELLAKRFAAAQDAGQLATQLAPLDLARLTQAVLHSLAVRARAGDSRATLERLARQAIALLCATP
jgi:AcrR family transcriptional regulator